MSSYEEDDDDTTSSVVIYHPTRMALGKDTDGRVFVCVDDLLDNLDGLRLELEMKTLDQSDNDMTLNATIMMVTLDVVKGIIAEGVVLPLDEELPDGDD